MTANIILIIWAFGLSSLAYILGRIHGRKKARKATLNFIRQLPHHMKLN